MKQPTLRFLCWSVTPLCFGVCALFLGAQDKSKSELDGVKPETVKGCYELTMSAWQPTVDIGKDEVFITPPHRIQLFAEKGKQGWEAEGYVVKAAPGIPSSIHRGSYWLPKKGQTIEIVWTTGFSGLVMGMKVEGDVMRGEARSFWDFDRKQQKADVVARKVDCQKP
jgi:hypothetical protein